MEMDKSFPSWFCALWMSGSHHDASFARRSWRYSHEDALRGTPRRAERVTSVVVPLSKQIKRAVMLFWR